MKRIMILLCMVSALSLPAAGAADMPTDDSFTNSIGMKFVRIDAGSFDMGILNVPLATAKGHERDGDPDDQRMVFVVEIDIRRQGALEESSDLLVVFGA